MPEPKYIFADSNLLPWQADPDLPGVEYKALGTANGQVMELSRYAPDTAYPAHVHAGPEFVFLLEGSARLAGQWLQPGWSSIGEAGTSDEDFLSGEKGCVFLAIYAASPA
ncbi:MAG: cupin domain-containing protein [Woeseiaceae bacterium]